MSLEGRSTLHTLPHKSFGLKGRELEVYVVDPEDWQIPTKFPISIHYLQGREEDSTLLLQDLLIQNSEQPE